MSNVLNGITYSGGRGVQMLLFRRKVLLDTVPYTWPVEITADSRYRMYINGQRVGDGPCRPSPGLRYCDRRDLAPYLTTGANVLVVWLAYYPPDEASNADFAGGPVAVLSGDFPFFALEDSQGVWTTDETWRCCSAEGYVFNHIVSQLSFMERVDLTAIPADIHTTDYDDSGWATASILQVDDGFTLVDRPIPFPLEERRGFLRVVRQSGHVDFSCFPQQALTIPPYTDAWVELDAGVHTTALPELTVEGGKGSYITVTYAESYKQVRPNGTLYKACREEAGEKAVLDGFSDCIIADGTLRRWMPFWYRTFRFVRFHIRTKDAPLRIGSPQFLRTGYPLETVADFSGTNADYNMVWVTSRRTLENCIYETYMDCPYYEQLQYVMDTVLQMQYLSKLTHDNRLTKRAMADFFGSQLPDGLISANSPAKLKQVIPGFALFAVYMLELYQRRYGDNDTVMSYLPATEKILSYFEASLNADNLVCLPEEWCFVDWVAGWQGGVPMTNTDDGHVIYTMMYAAALRCVSRLYRQNGRAEAADRLWCRADGLCNTLYCAARDETGLFLDELSGGKRSQHAQLWAVLSETITGEEATELMRRAWSDNRLSPVSYSMVWLLLRAMEKVGLYHLTESIWDKYLSLLPLGLTTWPEDDLDARSDCHAWSAVALYEFTAHGLGVREAADGSSLLISPEMLWLGKCEGRVATRFGTVSVSWAIKDGVFTLAVEAPNKIPLEVRLPNGEYTVMNTAKATYSIRILE